MSFKSLLGQVGIALKTRKTMNEVDKAEKQGFDVKLMLWKGAKTFALAVAMQCAPIIIEALSNGELISASLRDAGAPVGVVVALTALIVAGGKMATNWWNHRNGPK